MKVLLALLLFCVKCYAQTDPYADYQLAHPKSQQEKDDEGTVFPIDSATHNYLFSGIVNVDSAAAVTLFSRAKYFFADNFKNSKAGIQLQDESSNTLIFKCYLNTKPPMSGNIQDGGVGYKFTILTKDGRYKYTVSDFLYKLYARPENEVHLENEVCTGNRLYIPKGSWRSIKGMVYRQVIAEIALLKKSMANDPKKNDW